MKKDILIMPSVLSCDFLHLEDEIRRLNDSEADYVHYDVMDGKFVPEISFGEGILRTMKKNLRHPVDVHLMTMEPLESIESFVRAGADRITVHFEACSDLKKTIQRIRDCGVPAAVALRPETPVEVLYPWLEEVSMVLLMTVSPGFGGQPFLPGAAERIRQLSEAAVSLNPALDIQVDGGINMETVVTAKSAGANVFVSGSSLFRGDLVRNIREMKEILGRRE